VNLAAAIDIADLLRSMYPIDASLKWPNDILAKKHKLCGILSQMETEGDQVACMSIGIGLNVNNTPEREEPMAISLKGLLDRPVPRREILTGFLDRFEKRMAQFDPRAVVEEWKANNVTIGQAVRVSTFHDTYEGTAVDIDPNGGLVLRQADGHFQTVIHGDCFHQ
jgi:BirA family biotin operon repressor/biotin-[acetyl-CoA-carboxylase] ligase